MTKSSKVDCPCGRSFTKIGYSKHKCDQKIEIFVCKFCKKDFTTENRLINHLCEKKRRFLQRDDKPVKLGFMAYDRFFKLSMGKTTTYEAFSKSTMYGAFVRFGRHIVDLDALNPIGFIDFMIQSQAKIDQWTDLVHYSKYVRELNKNEPPIDAIGRNFKLMQEWAVFNGEDWCDFFRKVLPPQAVMWIVNGRLSPWLIFTASSAHVLLERLSPEQTEFVESAIDAEFWKLKIERHKQDVDTIRIMLAENGI